MMVRSCNVVFCPHLAQKFLEGLINKVGSTITYYHCGAAKSWEDDLVETVWSILGVNSFAR